MERGIANNYFLIAGKTEQKLYNIGIGYGPVQAISQWQYCHTFVMLYRMNAMRI